MNIPLDKLLVQLTVRDLLEILDYRERLKLPDQQPVNTTPLTKKVQVKALSSIYGWGESTIYGWCKKREIPHFVVGREKWFDLDVIDKWIASIKSELRRKLLLILRVTKGEKTTNNDKRIIIDGNQLKKDINVAIVDQKMIVLYMRCR